MSNPKLSIHQTPAMLLMLEDSNFCRRLYAAQPDFEKVLLQLQRDITTPENRDTVGPTILAIKNISDYFAVLASKGQDYANKEPSSK